MDPLSPKTSLLLERWYGGEREALNRLLEAHGDWIHRKVRQCMTPQLRARMETGDFVQVALLEFLENAPRFTIENGKLFRGLLFRIVVNTMREEGRWWRARRRDIARERPLPTDSLLDLESPAPEPSQVAEEREREAWVRLGLEFLEQEDLKVIVLRDYDGLSHGQIGEKLGKSPDAVRMHHGRAVDRLSRIVGRLRRGQLSTLIEEREQDPGPESLSGEGS